MSMQSIVNVASTIDFTIDMISINDRIDRAGKLLSFLCQGARKLVQSIRVAVIAPIIIVSSKGAGHLLSQTSSMVPFRVTSDDQP